VDGIDGQLIIRATAAAGLAKTAVDVIRTQRDLYSWVPPLSAFVLSLFILVCLYEANGARVDNRQTVFTVVLGAFVAAPMAIGATAVQAAVERRTSDQKVSYVQDLNATTVVKVAEAAASNATTADIEAASRRGAQIVIDELRARTAV
jgi:hypothetical protein